MHLKYPRGLIIVPLQWHHNKHDGFSNHNCLLNCLFRPRSKKSSKLRITGFCAGNSLGTGEFPTQMASYSENVSIWWCHHDTRIVVDMASFSPGSPTFVIPSGDYLPHLAVHLTDGQECSNPLWSLYSTNALIKATRFNICCGRFNDWGKYVAAMKRKSGYHTHICCAAYTTTVYCPYNIVNFLQIPGTS